MRKESILNFLGINTREEEKLEETILPNGIHQLKGQFDWKEFNKKPVYTEPQYNWDQEDDS